MGIAVLFGALAFSSWWSSRDELRAGSKDVRSSEPLEVEHVPTTYRAVYRVENRSGEKLIVTTEKVWVRRPFASRIETYRGAPPGARLLSLRQSGFGVLASESPGSSAPLNIAVPPSLAGSDLRVDAALDEALGDERIIRRERREVYGRQCQVYRAGGPVLAGDIVPYEPGEGTYADFCVDRNGIVIEEYWVDDDRLLRRRVATDLDVDTAIDDDRLDIRIPENPDIHRGAVERITQEPSSEGIPLWTLPKTPKGFDKLGRYGVIISDQAVPKMNVLTPAVAPASTSDVYVRGPDLLVVDQDPSLAQLVNLEKRIERKIEIDGLENARIIVDARMNEVRAQTKEGSIVRVFGTLRPEELIEFAQKLRPLRV